MTREVMNCDWHFTETKTLVPARYIVCTGRIDTMTVKEFFICDWHADQLCGNFTGKRGMMGGITFDDWLLEIIHGRAHEFYVERNARRIVNAARNASIVRKAGNLPYSFPQPDHGGVRWKWGIHRYQGKVRFHLPLHRVRVGARAAVRDSAHQRT